MPAAAAVQHFYLPNQWWTLRDLISMFGTETGRRLAQRAYSNGHVSYGLDNQIWYRLCIVVSPLGDRAAGTDVLPVRELNGVREARWFVRRYGQGSHGSWQ